MQVKNTGNLKEFLVVEAITLEKVLPKIKDC